MVAMSEERESERCDCSLRYLKSFRVYSSRYFHEAQTHLAKLSLSLAEIRNYKEERTSSSLVDSKLLNILGNEAQTEPPNIIEASAIEAVSSLERISVLD